MCTYLLLLDRFGPGTVALAANRDEDHDRSFEPPALREAGEGRALFPLDLRGGGTWLGAGPRLLVALTNAPLASAPPEPPSRGRLVRELLGSPDAAAARSVLKRRLDEEEHAGFNLLAADGESAWSVTRSDAGTRWSELGPGLHLLHDRRPGSAHVVEHPAGASDLRPRGDDPREALAELGRRVLASHDEHPLLGRPPCRHGKGRGTVASTLAFLDRSRPERCFLLFAHGPPCTAPWRESPWPEAGAPEP